MSLFIILPCQYKYLSKRMNELNNILSIRYLGMGFLAHLWTNPLIRTPIVIYTVSFPAKLSHNTLIIQDITSIPIPNNQLTQSALDSSSTTLIGFPCILFWLSPKIRENTRILRIDIETHHRHHISSIG